MKASRELQAVKARIVGFCEQMETMFTRPSEVKITVIVRTPWIDDGGILVTNDDTSEAIIEAQRLEAEQDLVQ